MANVRYYIDKGNILLSYYIDKKVMRFSVKESIEAKYWDAKKQRAKYSYKYANKLNTLLDNLSNYVLEINLDYKVKGLRLDSVILKRELHNRVYGVKSDLFFNYGTEIFLNDKKNKVDIKTLQTYTICVELINRYLPSLRFADVNRVVCLDLEKKMKADNYSINYINRVFKVFHNVIKNAYIDEIHDNKYYMADGFVPSAVQVDNIYLTVDDLERLYNFMDMASDKEKNVINIFLRGCFTGQRHQTYSKLSKVMIYSFMGVDMISIKQEKVNHIVNIPLTDKLKVLMDIAVKNISQQKLNNYIKEICKKLQIPNWDKVSSHTARRTFATNMVLAGVDISKIMKITGHKTETEFRKYVKIDGLQSAVSVINDINKVFGSL